MIATKPAKPKKKNEAAVVLPQLPFTGLVIGVLAGFDEAGQCLVSFDGNPAQKPVAARALPLLATADIGKMLALQFERADLALPVVLGLLSHSALSEQARPLTTLADGALQVHADGQEVVLSATRKLTLRCGRASITLDVDGNVEMRGQDLLSRAAGQNRIKGSSISLN